MAAAVGYMGGIPKRVERRMGVIAPAADKAAQHDGQMHGQEHAAHLGDLTCQEGKIKAKGETYSRHDQLFDRKTCFCHCRLHLSE